MVGLGVLGLVVLNLGLWIRVLCTGAPSVSTGANLCSLNIYEGLDNRVSGGVVFKRLTDGRRSVMI